MFHKGKVTIYTMPEKKDMLGYVKIKGEQKFIFNGCVEPFAYNEFGIRIGSLAANNFPY